VVPVTNGTVIRLLTLPWSNAAYFIMVVKKYNNTNTIMNLNKADFNLTINLGLVSNKTLSSGCEFLLFIPNMLSTLTSLIGYLNILCSYNR
jgi:hypothetical protein